MFPAPIELFLQLAGDLGRGFPDTPVADHSFIRPYSRTNELHLNSSSAGEIAKTLSKLLHTEDAKPLRWIRGRNCTLNSSILQ